jgi:hypothetical protein
MERNHQVQMMRQIYSNAQSVSVWLGEADDSCDSDVAMDYLAARKPLANNDLKPGRFWNKRQAKGVLALCKRNYWRRIWVVQEIMLAREATIYCGSKHVSWQKFEELIRNFMAIQDRRRDSDTLCVSSIVNSTAFVILDQKSFWSGKRTRLMSLLKLYRNHQATDIRDKVYALHGLAEDSLDMVVNYNKSTKNLFVEVLYHTCASLDLSHRRKWAAANDTIHFEILLAEIVQFGILMAEMLRVHCPEDEIKRHVSIASRRAHETLSMRSSSSLLDLTPI